MIGLKHPHKHLFHDIAWSTERVYRQTAERAASIGLELVTLPAWYDVDDAASLSWLCREVLDGRRPPQCIRDGYSASQTREYPRGLIAGGQKGPDKMSETGSADTRAAQAAVHKRSGIQLIATEEAFAIPSPAGLLIDVRTARGC